MKATNEALAIARHISGFLSESEPPNKSYNTMKSYNDALSLYIGFLEVEKGVKPGALNKECFGAAIIEEWLSWLANTRASSPETCNSRLASLRSFLRYISARNSQYLKLSHEASRIQRSALSPRQSQGLSKDAIKALLAAPNISTKAGRRDLALISAMYETAARMDEILSLKVEDLNLASSKPTIKLYGTAGKPRSLKISSKTAERLRAYLSESHGEGLSPDSYVFYSRNVGPKGKMSQAAVNQQLRKQAQTANRECPEVPLDMHARLLRYARAANWLEEGVSLAQISSYLGHAQVETTSDFLGVSPSQSQSDLEALSSNIESHAQKKGESLSEFCGVKALKK